MFFPIGRGQFGLSIDEGTPPYDPTVEGKNNSLCVANIPNYFKCLVSCIIDNNLILNCINDSYNCNYTTHFPIQTLRVLMCI